MNPTSVRQPPDLLHASRLLDDIKKVLGSLLILQLVFTDPSLGEQIQQVRVKVVGIPADMTHMPDGKETKRDTNIVKLYPPLDY